MTDAIPQAGVIKVEEVEKVVALRLVFVTLSLIVVGRTTVLAQEQTVQTDRPNILYILADDLGYGDVHCLNPERGKIPTPRIDLIAKEGMVFTDAHSGSSVCTPTRYGVLTGRYAWRTRLQSGVLGGLDDPPLIAEDRLTVGEFLQHHGYHTACLGKWHLGFLSEEAAEGNRSPPAQEGRGGLPVGTRIIDGPLTRGFHDFFGCSNARTMRSLIENDRVIELIEPIAMLPRLAQRGENYIMERAAEARAGRPFFLYAALTSPHAPIVPSREWQGRSGLNAYADFVMQTDAVVGRLLDALDRAGLTNNTLVVFTSDNGCSPVANIEDLEAHGHFPSGRYRGYKADIWDGGHRVPFLVRWPGRVPPGSTSDRLICLTDLLATCADLLEEKLSDQAGEDSVSLLPTLLKREDVPRSAVVHHSIHGRFAIRRGKWKLILCPGSGGWGQPDDNAAQALGRPPIQLYDLIEDAGESRNLHAERPDVVERLTGLLEKFVVEGRSTPGVRQRNDVQVTKHRPSTDRE